MEKKATESFNNNTADLMTLKTAYTSLYTSNEKRKTVQISELKLSVWLIEKCSLLHVQA